MGCIIGFFAHTILLEEKMQKVDVSVVPGKQFYNVQKNIDALIEFVFYNEYPGNLEIIVSKFREEIRLVCKPDKESRDNFCVGLRHLIEDWQ